MTHQKNWLNELGKHLRDRLDGFEGTQLDAGEHRNRSPEPLPRRWVELIHFLDEQERSRHQPKTGPGAAAE
jgi:hypothetical protein